MAVHDEGSKSYEPVDSEVVDAWHIDRFLADIYSAYRDTSRTPSTYAPSDTVFFKRPGA